MKRLNYKKFFFEDHRFLTFFIFGVLFTFFFPFNITPKIFRFLLLPFVMLPIYITNIIKNYNHLNILESNYFWAFEPDKLGIVLIVIGGICFSVVFGALLGKNKKAKKIMLYLLLIFFMISMLTKFFHEFNKQIVESLINSTFVGSGNLYILISTLITFLIILMILWFINRKFNLRLLLENSVKYSFMVLEVLLSLFVGLIFVNVTYGFGANTIDNYSRLLYIFFLGLFFFLVLETAKKYLISKIDRKKEVIISK